MNPVNQTGAASPANLAPALTVWQQSANGVAQIKRNSSKTKPLPEGTMNLTVNVPVELRKSVGRLVKRHKLESMGEFCRRMFERARYIWAAASIAAKSAACDAEALNLFERAQDPTSPGGRNITPEEAAPMIAAVRRSHRLDVFQSRTLNLHESHN